MKFPILALLIVPALVGVTAQANSGVNYSALAADGAVGIAGCAAGAIFTAGSRHTSITGGCIGGAAVGIVVGEFVNSASAAEAPSETELKSEDIKTLQDAKDLNNE
jgi:Mn2+/Fe2+ NRAMP family transporter